ncbi:hypothetical protein MesoLjLc_04260 [Mesorhizobium sp. L-8-10]|uniref:winged helix-turn-helix transcriptional regulator n=1 Tax=Mesorhizobium sp. L-8-10 TaxID=2744523 RepID=UPI001928AF92|nr:winged helix-turn-helix transcriptional regulator [Mesorhizobium sp. L-8-10]BCH28496.1 hypothetical protein MesoLjLc_04260 [Mesorhizobium sp. L-8-10]
MQSETRKPATVADESGAGRPAATVEDGVPAQAKKRNPTLLRLLAGRWKCEIMLLLAERTRRFGELRRNLPGVTQQMLATQLRALEANGLVERTVHAETRPRVEYCLTPAGYALQPIFDEIDRWCDAHWDAVAAKDGDEGGTPG